MLGTYPLGPCDVNGVRLSDGHTSGIQPHRIRERLGMSAFRLFTAHQMMIYRDHNAQSRSYDSVSMVGMRPPELVGVFQQTKFYIRFCYIEDKRIISNDLHESLLSLDICKCRWVTLLSQWVYIRINAIDEVEQLVDSNLSYLESSDNLNGSRTPFQVVQTKPSKI